MEDKYCPSTEEIRTAWFQFTQNVDSFDRWLAEVKAQAWEEGWTHNVGDSSWNSLYDNPYRQEVG